MPANWVEVGNLVDQFQTGSFPAGWSYGYTSEPTVSGNLPASVTPFTNSDANEWNYPPGSFSLPEIGKLAGQNRCYVYPGIQGTSFSTVVWSFTAPANGQYRVRLSVSHTRVDGASNGIRVGVFRNSERIFCQDIGKLETVSTTTITFHCLAGEQIRGILGPRGDFSFDGSHVDLFVIDRNAESFTGIGGEVLWICPSLDDLGNGTANAFDLTHSNRPGVLTNMDPPTDWVPDTGSGGVRAIDFDGVNDFTDYGANLALAGLSSFSFGGWVYKTSATEVFPLMRYSTHSVIGSQVRADYFGAQPSVGVLRPICYFSVAGNQNSWRQFTTAALSVPLNTWTYLGFSVNLATNSCRIFVNGNAVTATSSSGGTPPTAIAANGTVTWKSQTYRNFSGTDLYFDGRLDGLRVFNTYLDDSAHLLLASSRSYQPSFNTRRRRYAGAYGL
jgi:hypothetical protein